MYACEHVGRMHTCHGPYLEVKVQLLRVSSLLASLVPGVELTWSSLCDKLFYPLNYLSNPVVKL